MDWIALLFSSAGVSFRSGAVATKMSEGSERRVRLLPHNNLKRKSETTSLAPSPPPVRHLYDIAAVSLV